MTVTNFPLTLPLSEVFGPTWQGEGPYLGRRCGFVRLGHCNLTCEWCDTPYTWDDTRYDVNAECPPTPTADIAHAVATLNVPLMILSGGEPLLHAKRTDLCPLGHLLDSTGRTEWHVETNGTVPPPDWLTRRISHFSVSPKIGTRDPEHRRINERALVLFAALASQGRACFKFVASDAAHLDAIDSLCTTVGIDPATVWIMAEGRHPERILITQRDLAPRIRDYGYNLTTRLHVLLYGDERGV